MQVSPSLVKKRKTHFHNLPCGASLILGNNGYIWICPTLNEEMDDTGGYEQNFEVNFVIINLSRIAKSLPKLDSFLWKILKYCFEQQSKINFKKFEMHVFYCLIPELDLSHIIEM